LFTAELPSCDWHQHDTFARPTARRVWEQREATYYKKKKKDSAVA